MALAERIPDDATAFESYGRSVSSSYPAYLTRLGLNALAAKAEGATITDSDGTTYIDCVGGYGVSNVGHNNPHLLRALSEQLAEQQLLTRPLLSDVQVRLTERLEHLAPGDLARSFLLNSGSEAIDCAIKLVRLYRGGKTIITAQGAFHGHTLGALTASGIPSFTKAFEPLVPGFVHVPFGDIAALERAIAPDTAAVLLEPVQHEAGVVVPADGYLQAVRALCDAHDLILILDEVKTGFGKTGRMFACEHAAVVPDVLVLGKSLGGGLIPAGAIVARPHLWKRFSLSFSMSASSYAGNALACRAALATIEFIEQGTLLPDCAEKGRFLLGSFRDRVTEHPDLLMSADGRGLLIGIRTTGARVAMELARHMIRSGILMLPAFGAPSVLMVEPPLVISFEQVRTVADAFAAACAAVGRAERQ